MKLSSRNRLLAAAVAAAAVPGLVLASSAIAQAEPTSPIGPRQLAGMGSDTTQDVLNALSDAIVINGVKPIASYNSQGGAVTTKSPLPAGATNCTYAANNAGAPNAGAGIRANGSGAGRSRLVEASTSGNPYVGCLDFARSSSETLAAVTPGLTYIPFGLDGVSYAVRADSTNSRQLSLAALRSIYQCAAPTRAAFSPLLPQSGSGTRTFFLATIGVTEPEIAAGGCVQSTVTRNGVSTSVQENDGTVLTDAKQIVPYSAAQYSSQQAQVTPDIRGTAVLGAIGGVPAQSVNAGSAGTRRVFNVVPTSKVGAADAAVLNQVFVGSGSQVCQQTGVIARYGFGLIADCGSTTRTTG